MDHTAHSIDHLRAAAHGEGLAQGLAADGETGDQSRHRQGQQHPLYGEMALELHNDHRRGGTADDAADIAYFVVAEAADLVDPPD